MYDNWWNGGNRTVPQRHNMVGILTEAASVQIASPIFLTADDLLGGGRGFPPHHEPSVTFVDPWPGGRRRLRDIVDYELICARSLLTLAARYPGPTSSPATPGDGRGCDRFRPARSGPPFAWVVPARQRDPGIGRGAWSRSSRPPASGSEAAAEPVRGRRGPVPGAGSWILPASQAFRPHLKDMMERQRYPRPALAPDGLPEHPYDVAGWTLPLQMGL